MIPRVFMVTLFMDAEHVDPLMKRDDPVAHIWEYINKAGPMAVNGNPTFFSARFISESNWKRVADYVVDNLMPKAEVPG
jgi:hypothetical protein